MTEAAGSATTENVPVPGVTISAEPGGDVVGVKAGPVGEWFAANIAGAASPLSFELLAGGHSNLTYRVTDRNGATYVLRRPPTGAVLATAHDMAREHKIITGVGRTSVPVPAALGLCTEIEVNDAPFYVMSYVEGVVLDEGEKVNLSFPDHADRQTIGTSVVEVMAALHNAEPDDCGLGDLGRREAYLERQVKRWRTQWENSKTRELPAMETVAEALAANIPPQIGSGIVHGDYRLGNMLIGMEGGSRAIVTAVLDWELCTLGDVLADVGYVMNNWVQPGEPPITSRGAALPPTEVGGFCTREEFLARYEELTGRDTSNVGYYRAFQYWRLAAIVEGVMARYLKGAMGVEADTDAFKEQIENLSQAALDLINQW
ncbi:MAG: phosphotransferase family protein [Acidimicrobiales bacterium]